jgi:hypothetical protein
MNTNLTFLCQELALARAVSPEIAYGRSVATPDRAARQFVIKTLAALQHHLSHDHNAASAAG